MFDGDGRRCFVRPLALTLLAGFGCAGAGAGAEANDLRLLDAAKNQDAKAVRSMLSQPVDVNVRSSDGSTALLWLAHWNDVQTADLLLRAGADAKTANEFRVTPLSE